ncbi:MAG TPA: MerR family transcriptional regulator [Thermoanaerobaculia bacterium]|jgi:DNA-binding transcriptional MerR regulator
MWKVGQLAKRTGISVRTLHHYDQIGLLTPSHRTASGHRLYDRDDVVRLQQIVMLRQLGFALEEIGATLAEASLPRLIDLHLARLREQIERERRLMARLERMSVWLRAEEEVSVDEFFKTIEEMTMFEKYMTEEQLETIRKRGETLGAERIEEVQQEWPRLIEEVRQEMQRGTDVHSPRVQALAQRWMALVGEFSGGDAGIEKSVANMYQNEPGSAERFGFDMKVWEYIRSAMRK